ncbi:tRNA pseudouridine(13) synthase TruD [Symbiobacterium thermophilum]|uniref:tRNA pseudouridine(13) synthase TruD n=1 Tax=Symbiobacterium thermophilum TaxID=2734 RepID=UPI00235251D2|nr:tRNA pseudouridine(13) synthase TruD [Symbiobacterium thermophilum]
MRLKTTPEDFVVREAVDLHIRQKPARYRVYLLEKKGWNTADAVAAIARARRLPPGRIQYGGKKDRHAHTFQYVTIDHPADHSLSTPHYRLKAVGYATEPMAPGRVLANHFEVTVRELRPEEAARLVDGVRRVAAAGFPNYFDDQRFGSFDPRRGFIAEQMAQGRWEQALQIALTHVYPGEKSRAKARKRRLLEAWGDWATCLDLAETAFERRCFALLAEQPGGFRAALATARREEQEMWLSAWQAFLWNEVLRRLVAAAAGGDEPPAEAAGVAGPYRFARPTPELQQMVIPLPGRGMRFSDPRAGLILEDVLRERRLRPAQLEAELLPGLWLRSSPREAWVMPRSVRVDPPQPDERYPGFERVSLRFTLPRGAYATMLIKAAAH